MASAPTTVIVAGAFSKSSSRREAVTDNHVIDSPCVLWRGRLLDLRQGSLRGGCLGHGQHQHHDPYGLDRFRQVHVAVSISANRLSAAGL